MQETLICDKPYKVTNVTRDQPNNALNVISNKCNNLTKVKNFISDIVAYDFDAYDVCRL